jgi:hypothetical protein
VVAETVVSPKEVALESLSYTASEVVGGEGMGRAQSPMVPEGSGVAEGQKGGVAEVQRLEEIVSRWLVTPRFPPKMLTPQPNEGGVPRMCVPFGRKKVVCRSGERR